LANEAGLGCSFWKRLITIHWRVAECSGGRRDLIDAKVRGACSPTRRRASRTAPHVSATRLYPTIKTTAEKMEGRRQSE